MIHVLLLVARSLSLATKKMSWEQLWNHTVLFRKGLSFMLRWDIKLGIMTPWNVRVTVKSCPATSQCKTLIAFYGLARVSDRISFLCTYRRHTSLTEPWLTWVTSKGFWTTVRTFFITWTIDSTFFMVHPTLSYARCILLAFVQTFVNDSVANVFTS